MLLASDKPAAAIEHERYRAQAEQLWEGRQGIRAMYTPPAEAARRIADAILDDDAPLRVGCDDLSEGMLTGWRNAESDEAWMRPLLASFDGSDVAETRDHRPRAHRALRRRRGRRGRVVPRRARSHRALAAVPDGRSRHRARHGRARAVAGGREGRDHRRARRQRPRDRSDRVPERAGPRPAGRRVGGRSRLHARRAALRRRRRDAAPSSKRKGVRFIVDGIADVAGLRTTWFADPWNNVFILVEKVRRPDRRTTGSTDAARTRCPTGRRWAGRRRAPRARPRSTAAPRSGTGGR